jgi:hypothetical protein
MAKNKGGHPAAGGNPWNTADDYLRTQLPAELEQRGLPSAATMLRALPRVTDAKVLILALPLVAQIALFGYDQANEALKAVSALETAWAEFQASPGPDEEPSLVDVGDRQDGSS